MNFNSDCPERYKTAVLMGYLKRAHAVSSSWEVFENEITKVRQMLVNNGYSNRFLDRHIKSFMTKIQISRQPLDGASKTKIHRLLFKNQYHDNYLQDEFVLKKIIRDNVKPRAFDEKVTLNIYYKSVKSSNLVMRNSPAKVRDLAKCNLVYEFKCPSDECIRQHAKYIGFTTCTLSRRLSYHAQNGHILEHFRESHGRKLTRQCLVDNTKIRYIVNNTHDLRIFEALLILYERPSMNGQNTGVNRTLSLF